MHRQDKSEPKQVKTTSPGQTVALGKDFAANFAIGDQKQVKTTSPDQTVALGKDFSANLAIGDCVSLCGDLGAGKTVLVRGITEGLGLADTKIVSSPTYVLVHEYQARMMVYHLDLYRLADASAELDDLGLDEMLSDGIVLIEWANRASAALPPKRWNINIEHISDNERLFTISKLG